MIARHAFGDELATQVIVGILVISTTIGLILAYLNIERLQVDRHRAWMLRSMFLPRDNNNNALERGVNPLAVPFWGRQGYRPLWTTWEARPARMLR